MRIQELPWSDSPLACFSALRDLPWPLLLDSQDAGRWDILVTAPLARSWLTAEGWQHEGWPGHAGDSFAVLSALQTWGSLQLPSRQAPDTCQDWPFLSGVLGYIGYPAPGEHGLPERRSDDWPLACLALYARGCVFDHQQRRCWTWAVTDLAEDEWQRWLQRLVSPAPAGVAGFRLSRHFVPLTSRERYAGDIARIHDYIRAGDCYQVNYTQAYEARHQGSLWDTYPRLRTLARAPYGGYWQLPWGELLCLSPEQFLGVEQRLVRTRPIKGTRKRQRHAADDAAEARELLASAKDRAENIMITDLLRNDIGKHAETGSVHVPQLCALESFG
ncbi:MAG: chorismate-binding protein, partial [Perlucidibaca sp.]